MKQEYTYYLSQDKRYVKFMEDGVTVAGLIYGDNPLTEKQIDDWLFDNWLRYVKGCTKPIEFAYHKACRKN